MEAKTEITPHQQKIIQFRSNAVRQSALLKILSEEEILKDALAICESEKEIPAIAPDAPEIVSVRLAALARGAARVLDTLYLLATPVPPLPPEQGGPGTYGVDLSKLPPDTHDQDL